MKTKTNVKCGGRQLNHNQTLKAASGLAVKTGLKSGRGGQGGGGGEIGCDAQPRWAILFLDADDGELCIPPQSRYMLRAVDAQAGRSSAYRSQCYATNGVRVFQRIAGGSLAGND